MTTAKVNACIFGVEDELPTAAVVRSSQATPGRLVNFAPVACGTCVESDWWKLKKKTMANLNSKHWRRGPESVAECIRVRFLQQSPSTLTVAIRSSVMVLRSPPRVAGVSVAPWRDANGVKARALVLA